MRVLPCCNTQLTFCTLGDRLPEAICPSTEPGASCAEGRPLVGGGRPKKSQEEGRTYETNQAEGFPMWAAICFAANFAEHQCYKKKPPPKKVQGKRAAGAELVWCPQQPFSSGLVLHLASNLCGEKSHGPNAPFTQEWIWDGQWFMFQNRNPPFNTHIGNTSHIGLCQPKRDLSDGLVGPHAKLCTLVQWC